MVIKKPILTAMVKAVPIDAFGAVSALSEENCAEFPITANPQKTRTVRKASGGKLKKRGESKQRIPDANKKANATLALPLDTEK